jgi:hypothetical protein
VTFTPEWARDELPLYEEYLDSFLRPDYLGWRLRAGTR